MEDIFMPGRLQPAGMGGRRTYPRRYCQGGYHAGGADVAEWVGRKGRAIQGRVS